MGSNYEQFFDIRPKSKERPRSSASGHVYTPKATREFEALIASMYKGQLYANMPVSVSFEFSKEGTHMKISTLDIPMSTLRGDIDNYCKSFLDAMNGFAYTDDKQVVHLDLWKR